MTFRLELFCTPQNFRSPDFCEVKDLTCEVPKSCDYAVANDFIKEVNEAFIEDAGNDILDGLATDGLKLKAMACMKDINHFLVKCGDKPIDLVR